MPILFKTAERLLSPARLSPYKQAVRGDEEASLQLYLNNVKIAQSFYAPLSLLEVALRNALHDVLAVSFQSDNWLLTEQNGFMTDPGLTYYDQRKGKTVTNDKLLKMVKATVAEYREQRGYSPVAGTAITADLNFGFWTALFNKKHFLLLNRNPLRAFAYRPRGTSWEMINDKLTAVRLFRNRVYHYEPLCFQKQSTNILCFSQLHHIHTSILDLLAWIEPTLPDWLTEADRVPEVLKKLHKKYPDAS